MSKPTGTRVRGAAAVLAAVAVLVPLAAAAPAAAQSTSDKLDAARTRVHDLERKITAGDDELGRLKERLAVLSRELSSGSASLDDTRTRLAATTERLDATKKHLSTLRNRMKSRARNVYMRGPTSFMDVVLGSKTLSQFSARVTYASAIAREDAHLMYQVRRVESDITKQRDAQRLLEHQQHAEVAALNVRQQAVQSTIAATLSTVSDLAHERAQAQELVLELASQLGSEIFGLQQVAGRGMTITYGEWAASFLAALSAPVTRNNLVLVVSWEAAEGTLATWNPLATTYAMPDATIFNSVGVRNYVSKEQGIQATINTLQVPNHGYGEIVSGLKSSANPMDTGSAVQASDWCHGCAGGAYVVSIIPAVQQYYDKFAG